MVEAQVICK